MQTASLRDETPAKTLPLRTRPDLVVRPLWFGGVRCWGVKDPAAMKYFQLRDEEHFVLEQLRGRTTVAAICDHFNHRFAPRKLELQHLQGFLGLLFRQGLLVSEAAGQGEQLLLRRRERSGQAVAAVLANLLAIRLPAIDPHRFLVWAARKCGWMFSQGCLLAASSLVLSALLLVLVQFDVLCSRLPSVADFISPHNLFWLAVVLGVTKVLHEFAHGIACCRYGGECHEAGIMFLVLTPCLYCNVTDAWLFPGKWQRAAVGMAGIVVELMLAALATWGWWFTQPGLINSILLNTMVVCSVSTLLLNGNPLLRFDGYFVLCDVLEIPNLQPRAAAIAMADAKRWLLGMSLERDPIRHERYPGWLLLYALSSAAYRLLVVLGVLWFLDRVLREYDLQKFSILLVTPVLLGMAWPFMSRLARSALNPDRRRQVRPHRTWPRLAGLAFLIAVIGFTPLPSRLLVPAMLEPQDAERLYVSVPGTLRSALQPGQRVRRGDAVAELENRDVDFEIAELTGQTELLRTRLANLKSLLTSDPSAEKQIPALEESLNDLEQRRAQRLQDRQRLVLKSPRDGTILPAPFRENTAESGNLPSWSGCPLDERNRGSLLETGTLLCQVGDPSRLHALLVLDQSEVELVRSGQSVSVLIDEYPFQRLHGEITEVSELHLDRAPRELLVSGLLPVRTDAAQNNRPTRASYVARVALTPTSEPPLIAAAGRARVSVQPRSVFSRLWRFVRGQLRFGS